MSRGAKFLTATAVLAVAACSMDQGKLEIRSTPTALAQGAHPVSQRVSEGRAQLALGNVGLALEAFRIALREDPNSIDALAGLAAGYDRMGRFDLSRRNYEAALAIAPSDVGLLGAFAQSLQLQGQYGEAQRVQQEIALRRAAARAPEMPQLAMHPALPEPAREARQLMRSALPVPAPDVATAAPEARRADMAVPMALTTSGPVTTVEEAPAEIAIPRPTLTAATVAVTDTPTLARADISVPNLPEARVTQEIVGVPPPAEHAALGPSVTIKLPPARRVETHPAAAAPAKPAPVALAAATDLPPLMPYARPVPKPTMVEEQGPRLERLSMGEIGLITAAGPMWRTTTVARNDISTTVRFVPLRQAYALSPKVRLLNAARVNRLAARTRNWLVARGWQGLAIGDARRTRTRSVIYYPMSKRAVAQRLSAQFGFPIAPRGYGSQITVMLGTDAARHPALRPRRA